VTDKIRVTILEDHQSIVDGYRYRLSGNPQIEVALTLAHGDELEAALKAHPTDVLILDVQVPVSEENSNSYPILHVIPTLIQQYPDLTVLVISMHAERGLIRAVMDAGASGYILKDDQKSIRELGNIILSIASGGIFLSEKVRGIYFKNRDAAAEEPLSTRMLEVISLCAAYPNSKTAELAEKMKVANSTVRNLLSSAYIRLGVHTRAAAIARARQLGIIPHDPPAPHSS
jgi:two-component system nitrate/nitrite response regulator NarL